jgi:hypothetical protein
MSKAEDKTPTNALTVAPASALPAEFLQELEADAGRGVSTDPNEVGIPFLYILQDLSPQVKKRDPAYVEGAEVGDIYNNVTKDIIKAEHGFEFISCHFEPAQVEWKQNRGGFVAKHANDTPLLGEVRMTQVEDKMLPLLPNGNILTETKYYYGFYRPAVAEGEANTNPWEACVIGMSSTMIANSRELQALFKKAQLPSGSVAPSFAKVYRFGTQIKEKNNNSWFIWSITPVRWVDSTEYAAARAFAEQAQRGVKVANDEDAGGAAPTGGLSEADEQVL